MLFLCFVALIDLVLGFFFAGMRCLSWGPLCDSNFCVCFFFIEMSGPGVSFVQWGP